MDHRENPAAPRDDADRVAIRNCGQTFLGPHLGSASPPDNHAMPPIGRQV
jgi:hypothetical protein